jgi:hypothetical protein
MAARIVFPAVIALLAFLYGWIAQGFPSMSLDEGFGPGLFPAFIAATVGVLAVAEVLIQSMSAYRSNIDPAQRDIPLLSISLRELVATCLLVALIVATVFAIRHVGFIPAASGLVFALSLAMGMRPVWLSALASIAVALSTHFIFSGVFGLVLAF